MVKAKTEFVKEKGKNEILITEIPFDVNKSVLVKKLMKFESIKRLMEFLKY